jgi:XrtN system VIT domain protein
MINQNNYFTNYLKKEGVTVSLLVTLLSVTMLIIALFGIRFQNNALESLSGFSLVVEFFYGVIISFLLIKQKTRYLHLIPFLFLNWFIGCFCTNVIINIFENLPVWVYITTFTFCITNFFIYSNEETIKIKWFFYFINGMSYLLILYYMIYLIPIMPISLIGIIALGLGFYGLVPSIVFFVHLYTLIQIFSKEKAKLVPFTIGIAVVFIAIFGFVLKLDSESRKLSQYNVTKSFDNDEDIPSYIAISQHISSNIFNEILLKKNLVFIGSNNFFDFDGIGSLERNSYNERKTHDPFINVAYIFTKDVELSEEDRINILKSNFDKRLEAEEQLWSGNDLITKNIKEDVKIYGDERIAYTEITMDIACKEETWSDQEAIYSFQLPEGSVATSLSLWVNGTERKGVLTTKEKAQAAYRKIVSIENRDPSLMQWKEGNRIVVRVFPINYSTPRTFKCGFTTPLLVDNKQMKYQSLKITGPNISNASTISRLQIDGPKEYKTSKDFTLNGKYFINESEGLDVWEVNLPINNNAFSKSYIWNEKKYSINPTEKIAVKYNPTEIILDLDSSWTLDEIKPFIEQNNLSCFVYLDHQKQKIDLSNYKSLLPLFEILHYSLLPLFEIKENDLIIIKCGSFSANFEELNGSKYLEKIKAKTIQKNLHVINISNEINPFWQTIKEQKYVSYNQTDLKQAAKLIQEQKFLTFKKADDLVNIEPANIAIIETKKGINDIQNGSSHLFRLYAFGKVMDEQVKIQGDSISLNKYVALATESNIVSPVSSLIVLETDNDYKNNAIEKNINTLGNASINDKPASPLPYKGVLLMLALLLGFSFFYRKQKEAK